MTTEVWRRIPMAPDYEASNLGNVRNAVKRRGTRVGKILTQRPNSRGLYPVVDVRIDGRKVVKRVHRLVGDAFFGSIPDGLETRHLNGDGFDNRLANLRYGTHAENMQDAIEHGTHPSVALRARTHCEKGHPFNERNTGHTPAGARLCRRCGVAATIAWQKRELARREAAGEVTPHLIRGWAAALNIAGTGRLSNDLKWLYALTHPESGWAPTPDPRRPHAIAPTLPELITRRPEWSEAFRLRELRAA